jgi:hypothetical protein
MNVLKQLEQRLLKDPKDPDNVVLGSLIHALCMDQDFKLATLYELSYDNFDLALKVMKNWRTSRYTKTRERIKGMVGECAAEEPAAE